MAITEGALTDPRMEFVTALFTLAKDDDTVYRERHEREVAEREAKAAMSARMSARAKARKGKRFPGSRPYQSPGTPEWRAYHGLQQEEEVVTP